MLSQTSRAFACSIKGTFDNSLPCVVLDIPRKLAQFLILVSVSGDEKIILFVGRDEFVGQVAVNFPFMPERVVRADNKSEAIVKLTIGRKMLHHSEFGIINAWTGGA